MMLPAGMKPGVGYALCIVIFVLAVVILFQQRKLSALRDINAALETDARALSTSRGSEAAATADQQRELRQLRSENEQLRQDIQRLRSGPRE
jgi:cell division protein FtsB